MIYYHSPIKNGPRGPKCFHNRKYTHLTADTREELVNFAKKMGLNLAWLQNKDNSYFHFDITGKNLYFLKQFSEAKLVDLKTFAEKQVAKRNQNA